jgi:hypothetical protein
VNCPKCYAVLQLADKSRPACSCGWNMEDRDEELSDEKPAPISGAEFVDGICPA